MAQSSARPIWYVYGIVSSGDADAWTPPAGLDDVDVTLERGTGIAALTSRLDGDVYSPSAIETSSGDVDWIGPRATAHDRVLTWASDHGGGAVVPLPMFSVFSGRAALQAMLRERALELRATLARVSRGREYALRVYRVDAELLAAVTTLSPRLATLADQAAAASPGQRYLLERKLDAEKKAELRGVSQGIVDGIVSALAAVSVEDMRSAIPRVSEADARGSMVLNAAFLVAAPRLEEFQKTLTSFVTRHGANGFRFDFTGPWPPYHFATGTGDDA